MDIIFLVEESFDDAGYVARATRFPIYTEANNYLELLANIRGAVNCHFGEGKKGIERILVYKLETLVEVKEDKDGD